jgi:hypothetical protein
MKQVNNIIKELNLDSLDKLRQPFISFGIKNSQFVVILYSLLLILNAIGYMRGITLIAFGFIYPAQKTAEVYAKPEVGKANKWLAYWVIAAFILIFDDSFVLIPFFQALEVRV